MRARTTCATVALCTILAACGSGGGDLPADDRSDGGTKGSDASSGGGGGGAASPTVPTECASARPGPVGDEIAVRFTNRGSAPLWIGSTCSSALFTVHSCIDGYASPIARNDCNDCTQSACEECPAAPDVCLENIKEVAPAAAHDETWQTAYITRGRIESGSGCSCVQVHSAPAAKYRVRIDVYTSDPTTLNEPSYVVESDFELPIDGPVEVRIDR